MGIFWIELPTKFTSALGYSFLMLWTFFWILGVTSSLLEKTSYTYTFKLNYNRILKKRKKKGPNMSF